MRIILGLLLLPVLTLSAWADDPPREGAAPLPHAHLTWEQRFSQANVAHDGHLTLEEAKNGYAVIAKHFDDIDADRKGYVTEHDIRAWRMMRKAARRLTQPPDDHLKPRSAMLLGPAMQHVVAVRSDGTGAMPSGPLPAQSTMANQN